MRARKAAGRPAVSSPNSTADAKTTTRPEDGLPSTAASVPRINILVPPTNRGVSLGVTTTVTVVPKYEAIGWCRTSETRRPTAIAKAMPTTAIATTPGQTADRLSSGPPRSHQAISAATATAVTTTHTLAADSTGCPPQ